MGINSISEHIGMNTEETGEADSGYVIIATVLKIKRLLILLIKTLYIFNAFHNKIYF